MDIEMVQYLDPVATTAKDRANALKSSRSEPSGSVESLLYNHISRDIWSEVRGGNKGVEELYRDELPHPPTL